MGNASVIICFFFLHSVTNGPQASNVHVQNIIYYYARALGFASGCAKADRSKILSLKVSMNNNVAKCGLDCSRSAGWLQGRALPCTCMRTLVTIFAVAYSADL